jgi:hypothetical protein
MKISTILYHIVSGHMALPEFHRYAQSGILTQGAAL